MESFYTNVVQYGNKILYRGIDNGNPTRARKDFSPKLFIKTQKKTKFTSLFGEHLDVMEFSEINEAKDFIKQYSEVDNFNIFGNTNFAYQYITVNFSEDVSFDISKINIQTIDIETTSENGFPNVNNPIEEILLITLQNAATKELVTFGAQSYKVKKKNHTYITCTNEKDLLFRFLNYWQENCPDAITGWNCDIFDIPYMVNRIKRIMGEETVKKLSPWGIIKDKSFNRNGKEVTSYELVGIATLDYLDLYKKFTYTTRESYKLDYIAKVELGKQKLENPYDTFKDFYTKGWDLFVDYNVVDVELVDELEDRMKLIELIITMAYDAKCNFIDVFSAVRTWDCILYNHFWKKNIVVHQRDTTRSGRQIVGAYVQEPVPGKYDWVVSFDATSLYPSIIMQYNMSTETIIENDNKDTTVDGLLTKRYDTSDLVNKNYCMAANGHYFRRDKQGLMPEIVQKLFDDRQKYKKLMLEAQKQYEATKDKKYQKDISKYNNFQMARKIQLNSLFGAWANEWFRLYDDRIAEGITITGQYIIRTVGEAVNLYLNKICGTSDYSYSFYSDTDSIYITLDPLVQKFFKNMSKEKIIDSLDKICEEKIVKVINAACTKLFDYTNGFDQKIYFKREAISDRGIWVAKKRYALNVFDNEGVRYSEPKLKVMGLEIVRSSTPEPIRNALKEAVKIALTKTEKELQAFIEESEKEFKKMSAAEIAFPRGVNGVEKYSCSTNIYKQATPMHVRGSLLYNNFIKVNKLEKKYEAIQEGDKIKFIYLKEPNPLGENCIAFMSKIPEEMGLNTYIDYDTMYQKAFIEPITTILSGLKWSARPQASLESLFA
jgi:DNA polymerase elongation subunit (family B)